MSLDKTYDRLAELYDDDMGRNIGTADIPFYMEYARQSPPVLELGCGTGRIMDALVKEGIAVQGLDNSPAMLKQAADKLAGYDESLWSLQKGDLAGFDTGCAFGLAICAFSTYSKVLTSQGQYGFFSSAYRALRPGGSLLMELFIQGKGFDALPSGEPLIDYENRPVKGGTLTRTKTIYKDVEPQVNKIVLTYTFTDDHGEQSSFEVDDFTRYSRPEELKHLAETNGFLLKNVFGNYDRAPFKEGDTKIILEAQRG